MRQSSSARLADYPIRPTVMKMTGRPRRMSTRRRTVLGTLGALAGVLAWAAMVRHIFNLG